MNENLTPLFVYGILRANTEWGTWYNPESFGVHNVDHDAKAQGALWWVVGSHGYPVAKFVIREDWEPVGSIPEGANVVVGDVLWVDRTHPWYANTRRMEEHAGYEVVRITVALADGDIVEAEAFHYKGVPRGERIPSGDWLEASNATGTW